ncbi:MAG TPA: zinc ribbon domain-containing protein [Pyrinomonadaceae bacterium]|nr:zinc ribbon domain-containing protein [Pyrinomonadaceae bacterium]
MFCPKCATQNLDGASFCRTCGANISLVSQALSGQLVPQPPPVSEANGICRTRRGRELTLEQPFKNFFLGIAFVVISIVLSRTIGQGWWFWMLIPAFSLMATGLAQFIRLQEHQKRASLAPPPINRSFVEPPRPAAELRSPVGSVTEGTTRHLGVEAPTRHLDHEPK